jgi:hypothetical protein
VNSVNMAVEAGMLLKMICECFGNLGQRLGRMPEFLVNFSSDVEAISMESSVPDCANPQASGSAREAIVLRWPRRLSEPME